MTLRMAMSATPPEPSSSRYVEVAPSGTAKLRLLKLGCVELSLDGYQARIGSEVFQLPLKECRVLELLMNNAGRVMSRRELLDTVWEPGYPDHNKTLEVHIRRLRLRLATCECRDLIRTVRGAGYMFDVGSWTSPVQPG
ncbi:winged helix-turn-helix domain-containing protein [Streptomyces sp. NPDC021020]|uniref:winged helix-turn-helix domain-containing protein n=1 Tax=Streptomyces sp. NPDC021020 TaxID=3365109 RepID=UPI0037B9B104